jgi:hypothetical protein
VHRGLFFHPRLVYLHARLFRLKIGTSTSRWFDDVLLGKVLGITHDEARKRFEELTTLPFVERYRTGEHDLRNIHESTRLGWRKRLAREQPERFVQLSAKLAACFADDFTPAGRIDWIYHLLCGDPKRGAKELESLDQNWTDCARPEDRYALASTLRELEDTELVRGSARVWVLLVTAWVRVSRSEFAKLADCVGKILDLARAAEDALRKPMLNACSATCCRRKGNWTPRNWRRRLPSGCLLVSGRTHTRRPPLPSLRRQGP